MKISANTLRIKQLIEKAAMAAFGLTLAFILGGVVVAEAAPAVVPAMPLQSEKVTLVRTVGKVFLLAVKIKDVQQNGKAPLVQFKF